MLIEMDEDIARMFQQSMHVSTKHGNSNHLMKVSYRWRMEMHDESVIHWRLVDVLHIYRSAPSAGGPRWR